MADESAPLSMGQLERKMKVSGTVKRTELYGAFVDIGVGVDAILHVSQMGNSGSKRISESLKVGDEIEAWVDKVDAERGQVIITMIEPMEVEWQDLADGQVYAGTVTRLENFGAFVNIGAEKEGLVHISEINHEYIKHPSQAMSVGDEVQVKVLSFSKRKRRINLSIKALLDAPESKQVEEYVEDILDWQDEDDEVPTAMEIALRRAMGDTGSADRSRGSRRDRRQNKRRRREQQNDIIRRTLEMTEGN